MENARISMMPSHAAAARTRSGNASAEYAKRDFAPQPRPGCGTCSDAPSGCGCVRGYSQGCNYGDTCAFPQPPPRRCYCMPAAFSSTCGQSHHRLLDAYGASRMC